MGKIWKMETKPDAIMLLIWHCLLLPIIFLSFVLYFPFHLFLLAFSLTLEPSRSEVWIIFLIPLITLSTQPSIGEKTFKLWRNKCQQTESMYKPLLLHPLRMSYNWWGGSCFGCVASIFTCRNPLPWQKIWAGTVLVSTLYVTKQRGWESSWSHNAKGRMDAV